MYKKVLIANRGEIAVRIIRACQEMGIRSVAVHSTADREALHVRLADEAVCIGAAASRDSYLNAPNIIAAAHITGADAIHPGYGYLSEQAAFAEACEACGIAFIGPTASVIEHMGDKAKAREIARRARVPIVPGSDGPVSGESDAARVAHKIGFPLYIKAVAGGGGTGIRLVSEADDLPQALQMAMSEADAAFGRPEVYLEKLIPNPRHIEAQIMADHHGHVVHLGLRECSVQNKRHKKLIEECPASDIPAALSAKIAEAAVRFARSEGYRNVGTIEFLVDQRGEFYFMEANTRLQVEHPVTEAVTGIDIVQAQIRIAAGEPLWFTQKSVRFSGWALECRITAEDPEQNYAPQTGRLEDIRWPGGPGVRIDTHIYPGYEVPPYYDPMLAKIIVWAPTRGEAIARMERSLRETMISGVPTNLGLHRRIMVDPFYRKGAVDTGYIARQMPDAANANPESP
ncbi:MAG: acetyl-CoA carboxylase biotin carboxylase subunit [Chthonomonadales bacterium]|nr:acetyl-CoA carboxylase biotin carboxylase subunit [Chthonomonadales bacterium]